MVFFLPQLGVARQKKTTSYGVTTAEMHTKLVVSIKKNKKKTMFKKFYTIQDNPLP